MRTASPPASVVSAATPSLHTRFDLVRDQLLLRDAARLSRQLAGARNSPKFDAARFEQDVEAALLAAENRARLRPATIRYPAELPVVQAKDELLAAIRDHQVVVVCGETGSGKTTQLPKLCLELGRGTRGLIAIPSRAGWRRAVSPTASPRNSMARSATWSASRPASIAGCRNAA